jgi:hypothetical protein
VVCGLSNIYAAINVEIRPLDVQKLTPFLKEAGFIVWAPAFDRTLEALEAATY